jgi:hypothetical protein
VARESSNRFHPYSLWDNESEVTENAKAKDNQIEKMENRRIVGAVTKTSKPNKGGSKMKQETIDFLKNQIEDAKSENKSVNDWLDNGRWSRQVNEFLNRWLCDDVELERNGRTNTQMACDLADELKKMRQRNEMRIAVANWYLGTGRTPVDFTKPLLDVMDFETAVDNAIGAISTNGNPKLHKYFGSEKKVVCVK